MNAIDKLMKAEHTHAKRIAVVGDAMRDLWITGDVGTCQEFCPCLRNTQVLETPGGAANAALQLEHWPSQSWLISPMFNYRTWQGFNTDLCFHGEFVPVKYRHLDRSGRIVFRHDEERPCKESDCAQWRELTIKAIKEMCFDAVLISDYDKGFLDVATIQEIISLCKAQKIPCVADAKREPITYSGATLKYNNLYKERHKYGYRYFDWNYVQSNGAERPFVCNAVDDRSQRPVVCINHVGAGDCFAVHLTLALAHSLPLVFAAEIAHAAGRVYVQHPFSRPPWPHEIKRDLDPVLGKIVFSRDLAALRKSSQGRIVFANGVFRVPHAGHAWLLDWARQQGDVLVLGVNDDASARRLRPGEVILPLDERIRAFAQMSCVDWIMPFAEDDPCETLRSLEADVLIKGGEYQGQDVPGHDLVKQVLFAPPGPFAGHSSDLVMSCRNST